MRVTSLLVLVATASGAGAQQWSAQYEAGLSAARALKWADARAAFKKAITLRTDDTMQPTLLPGPVTERRQWRNGGPYSPNFLAAYAGFRASNDLAGDDRMKLLGEVSAEFEALLAKNQLSAESFFFLNNAYVQMGATEKRMKLEERLSTVSSKLTWKVDNEAILPEDQTAVNAAFQRSTPIVSPPANPTNSGQGTAPPANTGGGNLAPTNLTGFGSRVAPIHTKYAILIGNAEGRIQDATLPFASDSAHAMREALVTNGGYAEANVTLLVNATNQQITTTIEALAERMPQGGGTVFVYYAGVGANLDGRDYLVGVDCQSMTDATAMVAKSDVFKPFVMKEANIFSFFEVNRPKTRSRFFGEEMPAIGRISQMFASTANQPTLTAVRGGKIVGLFTDGMIGVINDVRSNQIPIHEYGWAVFDRIRGGRGGGSAQTCTLPARFGMSADARF